MQWDVHRRRGAGFVIQILHPVGAYSILANLHETPHLSPADLKDLVSEANVADGPLVGARDLSAGITAVLGSLRRADLVTPYVGGAPGTHVRYELTPLGTGLVEALAPVTAWAMGEFDLLVAAIRTHHNLPALAEPASPEVRKPRTATGMALGLFDKRWAFTLMVYIDMAGCSGTTPSRLNAEIATNFGALAGSSTVTRRLLPSSQQPVLRHLQQAGLLERHRDPADPPHVWYRLSGPGKRLMAALWEVGGWGMEHDAELFRIVAESSGWFPQAQSEN